MSVFPPLPFATTSTGILLKQDCTHFFFFDSFPLVAQKGSSISDCTTRKNSTILFVAMVSNTATYIVQAGRPHTANIGALFFPAHEPKKKCAIAN